jgi:hypothetical protein
MDPLLARSRCSSSAGLHRLRALAAPRPRAHRPRALDKLDALEKRVEALTAQLEQSEFGATLQSR